MQLESLINTGCASITEWMNESGRPRFLSLSPNPGLFSSYSRGLPELPLGKTENGPSIYPFVLEGLSWPFEDAAMFKGDDPGTADKFRKVQDQSERTIQEWFETLAESDKDA